MNETVDADKVELLEPIKQAIMLEIHGLQFYKVAAGRCSNPAAREMFEDLAKDEIRHRAELERQFRSILKESKWRPPPAGENPTLRFRNPVIDRSLKEDIEGAWFDFAGERLRRRRILSAEDEGRRHSRAHRHAG